MLPQLGQQPLYEAINFNTCIRCKSMRAVHDAHIPGLNCPSDPMAFKVLGGRVLAGNDCNDGSGNATVTGPVIGPMPQGNKEIMSTRSTNYLGSFGDGFVFNDDVPYTWGPTVRTKYGCGGCGAHQFADFNTIIPECPSPTAGYGAGPNHRGIWEYSNVVPAIRFASITDGMSQTIMFGHNSNLAGGPAMVWFSSVGTINGTSLPINFNIERSQQQRSYYCPGCTQRDAWWRGRGFQSHHPRGSMFAMCDGSVTYLAENIAMIPYNALGSRAGGESVASGP
jgi:prepilin-type processing-associated H-X9-DG protein